MVKKKTPGSLDKNDQFDSLLPTEDLMNFLRNEFGERVKMMKSTRQSMRKRIYLAYNFLSASLSASQSVSIIFALS